MPGLCERLSGGARPPSEGLCGDFRMPNEYRTRDNENSQNKEFYDAY